VADNVEDREPAEGEESRPDDRRGDDQPDGGVDPVTASPQEYPGKPGT
jgi:hypothetical protein